MLKEKSIPSFSLNADDNITAFERYEVSFGDISGDLNRSYTPIFLDDEANASFGESTELSDLSFFTISGVKLILRL